MDTMDPRLMAVLAARRSEVFFLNFSVTNLPGGIPSEAADTVLRVKTVL
jgi:hypothetical protein